MQIQFAEMKEMGTLEGYPAECGFIIKNDSVEPENEVTRFEKQVLLVA